VILRMVATARYLHLKSQELHEALMEAHGILGEDADERVRLREEGPAHEAIARRVLDLTDQLSALTNKHQEAQATALPAGMPASSEVRSDWSSRISLGSATTSPQPWPRPTRK
jgi:hypothetical protein